MFLKVTFFVATLPGMGIIKKYSGGVTQDVLSSFVVSKSRKTSRPPRRARGGRGGSSVLLLFGCASFFLFVFAAAATAHSVLKLLALFWCHVFQTMLMPLTMTPARPAQAAEQYLAQHQHAQCLHVTDLPDSG